MSPTLHHECIRTPVTALATVGHLLLAAEGPYILFYHNQDSAQFRFLGSKKVFQDQAIHGISTHTEISDNVILAIWGGTLVRFIDIGLGQRNTAATKVTAHIIGISSVVRAPDWILDLSFGPTNPPDDPRYVAVCAAVTAHNALIELRVQRPDGTQEGTDVANSKTWVIHLSELTSSSRSILYSAHLLWDSTDHILVAAGTAFGEIIYWSWANDVGRASTSAIHKVFLGHEGSIFGVRISDEYKYGPGPSRRFLASCSDDRTIRVWDLSGISTNTAVDGPSSSQRTRHTGFSKIDLDVEASNSACIAVGWGHLSRVWAVQFLGSPLSDFPITLLSSGEDATSRLWQFKPEDGNASVGGDKPALNLVQVGVAGYHNGKNLWSTTLFGHVSGHQQVICGAADSKISSYALPALSQVLNGNNGIRVCEYTIQEITEIGQSTLSPSIPHHISPSNKSSKAAEFFRGYAFIDGTSFLLTTNSGRIYLETLHEGPLEADVSAIARSELVDYLEDVSGYSVCASESTLGLGFVAGSRGSIYVFRKGLSKLSKIHIVQGKVGSMFTGRSRGMVVVLVTLMGQKTAQLLYIDAQELAVTWTVSINLSDTVTGATITSMAYTSTRMDADYMFLGFRAGSIAAYTLPNEMIGSGENCEISASCIKKVHGKETVTSMLWIPALFEPSIGHLVSVGRDGCCAIHRVDPRIPTMSLHHFLPLPVGPNVEGVYNHHGHLIVYGFSSTKFVVYNINLEEEIMSVETGGSHRSWSFQPHSSREGGGTLVWTRASTMHICSQIGPNHSTIRSGGHGREIKSVAVSRGVGTESRRELIATGAEDTDIKIFEYVGGDLVCRRTLRKHNTGIQHLAWSDDGEYLFSSGGCEEFCVWRVRILPPFIGLGIICESVCAPETEHSDVRLTSFDVRKAADEDSGFVIAMVFSDSNIRVYSYSPTAEVQWHMLFKGVYFTSCLTQCVFLSPQTILTTGTDGHAVLWPLPSDLMNWSLGKPASTEALKWQHPARIHQNTSKTLDTRAFAGNSKLVVSGGDDGSLAFLLAPSTGISYTCSPIIVVRAHASAITACFILSHGQQTYVLTTGNDQWIRLWEVVFNADFSGSEDNDVKSDALAIRRAGKIETNIADVSSMAILDEDQTVTKVVICGVGMEIVRLEWMALENSASSTVSA